MSWLAVVANLLAVVSVSKQTTGPETMWKSEEVLYQLGLAAIKPWSVPVAEMSDERARAWRWCQSTSSWRSRSTCHRRKRLTCNWPSCW